MIVAFLLAALTMDEAVERALRNNPEAKVARASVAVAAAEKAVARALPAPEFRLSASNFDVDEYTVKDRVTIAMRYKLPRPWELAHKQEIARAREQSAEAGVRAAEARVAADVRLAFRRAVIAEQRAAIAERAVSLRKNRRRTVLLQVKAGVKESDEKDLADLAVDEAESEFRRAVSAAESERRKLARLIEPAGAFEFTLATDPDLLAVPVSVPSQAALVERAVQLRADLNVIDSTCAGYEAAAKLANSGRYPWFSFVQVSHRVTTLPERGAWGWQFGVDLPFFRSAASAEARVAAAQKEKCRAQQQALQTQIRNEVESGTASLEEVRRELAELERVRSGPAERALERTRLALAKGRADHVEVIDAEARVLSLQDRWLERRLQYVLLESELETALGAALEYPVVAVQNQTR